MGHIFIALRYHVPRCVSIIALPVSSANSRFLEFSRMASTHSPTKAPEATLLQGHPKCHNCSSECQKRGAATEHAERKPPGGRATEHAVKKAPGGRGTLKPYAQTLQAMEDAQADRANATVENLVFKLDDFLSFLLQDVWTGFQHATEHMICEVGEENC